ncbi:MAG: helix-turn-helix transcriptional regulator [Flavobacteriaceae bacterium]|nr:helix-turn-helix transcriptional regulator [Flavobacteriaceae bacterium]
MIDFKLTQGIAYYIGKSIETERHTHHALEFIFGIEQPFNLVSDEEKLSDIYGVVIHPNYPHQFIGADIDVQYLFIFLEPELLQVSQIKNHYNLTSQKTATLSSLSRFPNPEKVIDFSFFTEVLEIPIIHTGITEIDSRIKNVIELIKSNLEEGQISSDTLAKSIFLSESRFSHLFKEQIGIPVRRYILWCRIQEALKELLKGNNFTKSAHAAGFSDSAHFSRTFSEMFGVSPSSVLKK